MRRFVKIKATFILIAWTVIFMHGVIPHHHEQDQLTTCNSLIHEINVGNYCSEHGFVIHGLPDRHEKVCHYSALLFQLLNLDNFLLHPGKKVQIMPVILSGTPFIQTAYLDFSEPETDITSLRAPPVS